MIVLKRCSKCKELKELDDRNFERRIDRKKGWLAHCRQCHNARSRANYAARTARPVHKPIPTDATVAAKRSRELDEIASRNRECEIVKLASRYEAVRFIPGRDRDAAYNVLARALRQHGRAVHCGGRYWAWSEPLGELTSNPIRREWRKPEDSHADPCRIAWDSIQGPRPDLQEI